MGLMAVSAKSAAPTSRTSTAPVNSKRIAPIIVTIQYELGDMRPILILGTYSTARIISKQVAAPITIDSTIRTPFQTENNAPKIPCSTHPPILAQALTLVKRIFAIFFLFLLYLRTKSIFFRLKTQSFFSHLTKRSQNLHLLVLQ